MAGSECIVRAAQRRSFPIVLEGDAAHALRNILGDSPSLAKNLFTPVVDWSRLAPPLGGGGGDGEGG
eukprot:scaffold306223_cov36-Tisochrysis_lutea.AAC.1